MHIKQNKFGSGPFDKKPRSISVLAFLESSKRLTGDELQSLLEDVDLMREAFRLIVQETALKREEQRGEEGVGLNIDRVSEFIRAVAKDRSLRQRLQRDIPYDPDLHDNFDKLLALVPKPLYKQVFSFLYESKALVSALIIYAVVLHLPIPKEVLTENAKAGLAVFLAGIILWVTEALPIAVTALLICVLLYFSGAVEKAQAFIGYSADTMFFLIGAFSLGRIIVKSNLHKRIALFLISKFGKSPFSMFVTSIFTSGTLSMIMPEHAVGAMLFPIVITILVSANLVPLKSNFARAMILSISYGAAIGSSGSLLGGGRNPLALGILKNFTHGEQTITFFSWIYYAFPIVFFAIMAAVFLIPFVFKFEKVDLHETKIYLQNEIRKLGGIGFSERRAAFLFILAFGLWTTIGERIGLGFIAIAIVALAVALRALSWKDIEKGIPWSVVILYGGAVTLSQALTTSGAAEFIGRHAVTLIGERPIICLAGAFIFSQWLTELMSDSAAVGVVLPVLMPIGQAIGVPPITMALAVAMGAGQSYMLPISTPNAAVAYSTGYLTGRDMIKNGVFQNIWGGVVFVTIGLLWWHVTHFFPLQGILK